MNEVRMDYWTVKETAEHWGVSVRRVQHLCQTDKIPEAVKFGRDWAIPVTAKRPADARITSGKYIAWRERSHSF